MIPVPVQQRNNYPHKIQRDDRRNTFITGIAKKGNIPITQTECLRVQGVAAGTHYEAERKEKQN